MRLLEHGDGTPVLLLPGAADEAGAWAALAGALAGEARVLEVEGLYPVVDLQATLAALRALLAPHARLAIVSQLEGAYLALALLAERPELATAVLALCPYAGAVPAYDVASASDPRRAPFRGAPALHAALRTYDEPVELRAARDSAWVPEDASRAIMRALGNVSLEFVAGESTDLLASHPRPTHEAAFATVRRARPSLARDEYGRQRT